MELGAIGELVGGVAVLVTLIYLAVQVRQGRGLAQAITQREISNAGWDALNSMAGNRDQMVPGLQDFETLSKAEQYQFSFALFPVFTHLDQVLLMRRLGLENEGNFEQYGDRCVAFVRDAGGRQWWEIIKQFISPEVGAYIDGRLANPSTLPPSVSEALPWFSPDDSSPSGVSRS